MSTKVKKPQNQTKLRFTQRTKEFCFICSLLSGEDFLEMTSSISQESADKIKQHFFYTSLQWVRRVSLFLWSAVGDCFTLKRFVFCTQPGYLTFKNRASYIQDGSTATLQMFHFIYIFSTNISTEYFNMLHTLLFSLQNAVYFIMLPFLVPLLYTFYIQVCKNLNVKLRCQKVNFQLILA